MWKKQLLQSSYTPSNYLNRDYASKPHIKEIESDRESNETINLANV